MRTTSLAVLALAAAACSGQSQEAPVRSVAKPVAAPTPYRASPSGAASAAVTSSPGARPAPTSPGYGGGGSYASAPRPAAASGTLTWITRIAEAQSAARASGKLILVGSTKPGCSLCDKFAHTTAPQCWGRLGQIAVPYMYDITHPEDGRVDGTLRANLRGAALMPLVGFLTPDLQWVHGFSGPRTVEEFLGDIESARRIYPVHAAALPKEAVITGAATAMVNEYGENEWSAPADWPMPEDALGPVAAATPPAAAPAAPPAAEPVASAEPAPAPAPVVEPAPAPVEPAPVVAAEPAPAPAPAADPAAGWSQPASATLGGAIAASPAPLATFAPAPSAPAAAPSAPATAMTEDAAQSTLSEAFGHIRAGRFDDARAALRRVSQALPNTAVGREADRGAVAVYNARRISAATPEQRTSLAERARRDFAASMWADLF